MTMIAKPLREVADFREHDIPYVTEFRSLCHGMSKNAVLRALVKVFTSDKTLQKKVFEILHNGN